MAGMIIPVQTYSPLSPQTVLMICFILFAVYFLIIAGLEFYFCRKGNLKNGKNILLVSFVLSVLTAVGLTLYISVVPGLMLSVSVSENSWIDAETIIRMFYPLWFSAVFIVMNIPTLVSAIIYILYQKKILK